MTTLSEKRYNPATKKYRTVRRLARVTHARPHGRPGNISKRAKWRVYA